MTKQKVIDQRPKDIKAKRIPCKQCILFKMNNCGAILKFQKAMEALAKELEPTGIEAGVDFIVLRCPLASVMIQEQLKGGANEEGNSGEGGAKGGKHKKGKK